MTTHGFRLLIIAVCSMLLVSGCKRTYELLELTPDGEQIRRSLSANVDEEDYRRLAAVYGMPIDDAVVARIAESKSAEVTFSGTYDDTMPQDLGGTGIYLNFSCDMGESFLYSETVRGHDDLVGSLERQHLAMQRVIDIVLLFLDGIVGEEPGYADFRKVIDDHVRHDFRNLVTYMSTFIRFGPAITGEDTDSVDQQWMLRIMHYLQARSYLSADDVRYMLDHTHDLDEDLLAAYVLRAISNKMDQSDGSELPRPLEMLWDGRDELGDAFEEFVNTDPRLAEWVLQWNQDLDTAEHYTFEDGEYFDRLNEEMMSFEWHLFTSGDWLNVILNTGERPYETNGEWVVDGYVEWDQRIASLDPNDGDLPNLFYALWSNPDRQRQRAAFGFPAIVGEDLLEYCSWARMLSDLELQEWNDFVESLDPSDARVLIERLESFRFSDETEPRNSSYDDDPIESRKAFSTIKRIRGAITERVQEKRFRGL